jgi:multisubunit Na+/H+ antiporter MnhC subunit
MNIYLHKYRLISESFYLILNSNLRRYITGFKIWGATPMPLENLLTYKSRVT